MIRVTVGNNLNRKTTNPIPEDRTLRSVLEEYGVDYSIGMTSLDGSTLGPGDLDKTFKDFGITEKCFLINVVKADNAAEVKIVGNACVVESGVSLDDLKLLKKFRPNALYLYEGSGDKKEAIFGVDVVKGVGSINKLGVCFGSTPSASGKATVTMMIPEGTADPKKWAEELIGVAILHLNKVEAAFEGALTEVADEKAAVAAAITVL